MLLNRPDQRQLARRHAVVLFHLLQARALHKVQIFTQTKQTQICSRGGGGCAGSLAVSMADGSQQRKVVWWHAAAASKHPHQRR